MKEIVSLLLVSSCICGSAAEVKTPLEVQAVAYIAVARTLKVASLKELPGFPVGLVSSSALDWVLVTADRVDLLLAQGRRANRSTLSVALSGTGELNKVQDGFARVFSAAVRDYFPRPCVGSAASDVLVLASSPEVLRTQRSLYSGEAPSGGFCRKIPDGFMVAQLSDVDGVAAAVKASGLVSDGYSVAVLELLRFVSRFRLVVKESSPRGKRVHLRCSFLCKDQVSASSFEMGFKVLSMTENRTFKDIGVSRKDNLVVVTCTADVKDLLSDR